MWCGPKRLLLPAPHLRMSGQASSSEEPQSAAEAPHPPRPLPSLPLLLGRTNTGSMVPLQGSAAEAAGSSSSSSSISGRENLQRRLVGAAAVATSARVLRCRDRQAVPAVAPPAAIAAACSSLSRGAKLLLLLLEIAVAGDDGGCSTRPVLFLTTAGWHRQVHNAATVISSPMALVDFGCSAPSLLRTPRTTDNDVVLCRSGATRPLRCSQPGSFGRV